MIWFACKQCQTVHSRPDHSAGAMIFCSCGQGLTVPWESTASPPDDAAVQEVTQDALDPVAMPVKFDEVPIVEPEPAPLPPVRPRPRTTTRRGRAEPNPDVCFNHEPRPRRHVCPACELSFCEECVTTLRGELLCGPCKNHKAKALQQLPSMSLWALVSLFLALVGLPALLLLVMGPSWGLAALALVPHLAALSFGAMALRRCTQDGRVGGQAQAITGIVAATLAVVVVVAAVWTTHRWGS